MTLTRPFRIFLDPNPRHQASREVALNLFEILFADNVAVDLCVIGFQHGGYHPKVRIYKSPVQVIQDISWIKKQYEDTFPFAELHKSVARKWYEEVNILLTREILNRRIMPILINDVSENLRGIHADGLRVLEREGVKYFEYPVYVVSKEDEAPLSELDYILPENFSKPVDLIEADSAQMEDLVAILKQIQGYELTPYSFENNRIINTEIVELAALKRELHN